jgi:hypothetical protein
MNTTVPRGAIVVLVVFSVACGSSGPTSPSGTSEPPSLPLPTPRPLIDFPPLSGPSRTSIFDGELTYHLRLGTPGWRLDVWDFTMNSRFVLYDNGAFVLQYPPSRFGDGRFRGAYQLAYGTMIFLFEFQGRSVGEPGDATGTLEGDSLVIQYVETMKHADFEDAVYVLSSQ